MKKLISLTLLFILFSQKNSLSAEPLIRELCYYSEGDMVFGGKYKREIDEWKATHVILQDERLETLIQMYSQGGDNMNLVLYIYDGELPYVSLKESNVNFTDLLNSVCGQLGYVYWFEDSTIFMVPKDQLDKHRNAIER